MAVLVVEGRALERFQSDVLLRQRRDRQWFPWRRACIAGAGLAAVAGAIFVATPADSATSTSTSFTEFVDPNAVCIHQGYFMAAARESNQYSWYCFRFVDPAVSLPLGISATPEFSELKINEYCDWLYAGAHAELVGDPTDMIRSAWYCKG